MAANDPASASNLEILARMPKVELHVHLEGTVGPELLWEMATRNGVALPVRDRAGLRAIYRDIADFPRFVEIWMILCAAFRTERDYREIARRFAADCRRQRIHYAEAHFTPYHHERLGFGGRRALELVADELAREEREGGPIVRLIVDIPAETIPDGGGDWTLALLESGVPSAVVAIGLAGMEVGYPRVLAKRHFERARALGFGCVAHAGETGGAEHVREAVLALGARRVQHGIAAADDPDTLRLLVERDVCCDVALSSNLVLTRFRDLEEHPLRALLAAGVPVTLGSDDPPFFGTDLTREHQLAAQHLGLAVEQLWMLNLRGLRHALVDDELRARVRARLIEEARSLGLPIDEPARSDVRS
ncbi:MAG: adenosine deaminase [bacterium]